MKIAIGSDHKGWKLKKELAKYLTDCNHQVFDLGTYSDESVDYPDYAKKVCEMVTSKEADFGILVCYTGIGMSIAANKFFDIRAALVGNIDDAKLTREHNDANVLCLSSKNTSQTLAFVITDMFLNTEFTKGRHAQRIAKINEYGNK